MEQPQSRIVTDAGNTNQYPDDAQAPMTKREKNMKVMRKPTPDGKKNAYFKLINTTTCHNTKILSISPSFKKKFLSILQINLILVVENFLARC